MISEKIAEVTIGSIPWIMVGYTIVTLFYGSIAFTSIARAIICKEGRLLSIFGAIFGSLFTLMCVVHLL